MSFLLVQFNETNEVSIAPSKWMLGKTSCRWPTKKTDSQCEKAIRNSENVDETFSTYSVKVLYETDSYTKAYGKLKMAEETSDLQTEDETESLVVEKRKRRPTSRYILESPEKTPQKKRHRPTIIETPEKSPVPSKKKNYAPVPALPTLSFSPASPALPTLSFVSTSPAQPSTSRECTPRRPLQSMYTAESATQKTTAAEKKIITLLEEIKGQNMHNTQMINLIMAKLDSVTSKENPEDATLPEDIELPIENMEQFDQIEGKLEEQSVQKHMTEHLGTIGGDDVAQCVRRVLKCLMTNSICLQFNWKGKGEKRGFSSSKLLPVIKKAVRKNRMTSKATDNEIEEVIKDWFRFAKDRDGGRRRRQEERRQRLAATEDA